MPKPQTHLVIPAGTKVSARPGGRVWVVTHSPDSPDHAYRVRFPEGDEGTYPRAALPSFVTR